MLINIKELRLKNFKGIKSLNIHFGKVTDIIGENASGKTTVFDAFTWLLFDKDSSDRKDFSIKTYDSNGDVVHGLDHEVEGILQVDGIEIRLKKIYKEKWIKKRGEASKTLTGHTTEYFIDDVPAKKSYYTEKINSLIDENIFKLITNPHYFNTVLNWKDRRNILLEVVGDISDQDVIMTKKSLEKLGEALQNKSLEDYKKMVASRKKKLNDEIKTIPIRIDELTNSLEEITGGIDVQSVESQIQLLTQQIENIEGKILDSSKIYSEISKQKEVLYKKKDQLRTLENEQWQKAQEPKQKLQLEIFKLQQQISKVEFDIQNKQEKIQSKHSEVSRMQKSVENLRKQWFEENTKTLEFNENQFICPTCGQALPQDDIDKKKNEMRQNFEKHKKNNLDAITSKGKAFSQSIADKESENQELQGKIIKLQEEVAAVRDSLKRKEDQYKVLSISIVEPTEEVRKLQQEMKALEESIIEPDDSSIESLKEEKKNLVMEIDRLKYKIRAQEQHEKAQKRIQELLAREKDLANLIADLEGQEFLCDDFVRTKVDLLESRINEKFKQVRFKLFNTLVNGALEDCCETLIDGVPYSDSNTAAKMNAGIDIINTLSQHYNINAPIFIDNRESVNRLIDCNSQIVNLIVSKDKKLKVEVA